MIKKEFYRKVKPKPKTGLGKLYKKVRFKGIVALPTEWIGKEVRVILVNKHTKK